MPYTQDDYYKKLTRQRPIQQNLNYMNKIFPHSTPDNADFIERNRNIVENLHQEGLSREVYGAYLSTCFERDRQSMQSIISHIESADEPYIINNLEETGISKDVAHRGLDF